MNANLFRVDVSFFIICRKMNVASMFSALHADFALFYILVVQTMHRNESHIYLFFALGRFPLGWHPCSACEAKKCMSKSLLFSGVCSLSSSLHHRSSYSSTKPILASIIFAGRMSASFFSPLYSGQINLTFCAVFTSCAQSSMSCQYYFRLWKMFLFVHQWKHFTIYFIILGYFISI